jgi:hypothetical protein
VKYEDLSAAFDFVSFAAPMEHQAYISIGTGTIYWISELSPLEEEVPEDLKRRIATSQYPTRTTWISEATSPSDSRRRNCRIGSTWCAVLSASWRLCPIQGTPRITGQSG